MERDLQMDRKIFLEKTDVLDEECGKLRLAGGKEDLIDLLERVTNLFGTTALNYDSVDKDDARKVEALYDLSMSVVRESDVTMQEEKRVKLQELTKNIERLYLERGLVFSASEEKTVGVA